SRSKVERTTSSVPRAWRGRSSTACYSEDTIPKKGMPMREYRYTTPHGIQVTRTVSRANYRKGLAHLLRDLDRHRGIYLSSGYEYPGRYSRWDIASTRPPLEIVAYDRRVEFRPLNDRGRSITRMFHPLLAGHPHWEEFAFEGDVLAGRLK